LQPAKKDDEAAMNAGELRAIQLWPESQNRHLDHIFAGR
jgi:hypothetical protein